MHSKARCITRTSFIQATVFILPILLSWAIQRQQKYKVRGYVPRQVTNCSEFSKIGKCTPVWTLLAYMPSPTISQFTYVLNASKLLYHISADWIVGNMWMTEYMTCLNTSNIRANNWVARCFRASSLELCFVTLCGRWQLFFRRHFFVVRHIQRKHIEHQTTVVR